MTNTTDAGRAGAAPSPRFQPRRHWLRWAVWDNERQCYAYQGRTWPNRELADLHATLRNMERNQSRDVP